jgi:hypothetical protein
MSGHLWLPQPASVPVPGEVAAYLLQQGWILQRSDARWAEYARQIGGEMVVLEVPQQAGARDYARTLGLLIEDIARLESRTPSAVLRDLKASSVDIVRLTIDSAMTRDGRIPVEAGHRVYEAARDLLLSAACSVIDPRPAFARRKPEEAMGLLQRARFGQTELGSFVLTIECTIAPRLQQPLLTDDGDPDAPLERRTYVRLAHALEGAEAASRESAASGRIEPFRRRAQEGVSANLCEAMAEMLDATAAEAVRASFSFAVRRPLAGRVPRTVVFTSDTAVLLREAAARLREEATYPATEIAGPVVKLDSADPAHGGEAVVHAVVDGRRRHIRAVLGAGPYRTAISAHLTGATVRCVGDLVHQGRSWILRNPRDFAVVTDPA